MIRRIISPTNGRDAARDFGEVGRHRLGVDGGQDQACGNASCRTDRAEDIRPLIACAAQYPLSMGVYPCARSTRSRTRQRKKRSKKLPRSGSGGDPGAGTGQAA